MLKINKVYLYDDIDYIYVHDKKKVKRRLVYTVSSIDSRGNLLTKRKTYFRRGLFVEQKEFQVKKIIIIPKVDRDKILFEGLVKQANTKIDLAVETGSMEYLMEVGRLGHACIGLVNKSTNEYYNLRDFARAVKIKSFAKVYAIVAKYLKSIYPAYRYKKQIPSASDTTIVSVLQNYTVKWKTLYGFSNKIDKILETELAAYQKEAVARQLHKR